MNSKNIATTKEIAMAEISVYALILHQNQRRIKIKPVPAPICNRILNASKAEGKGPKPKKADITISPTVEILPTATNSLSDAFRLDKSQIKVIDDVGGAPIQMSGQCGHHSRNQGG